MARRSDTRRYTAEQLRTMIAEGKDQTDWNKVKAMTEAELEASIARDPDDVHEALDWSQAIMGLPPGKDHINIRVDRDVLAWFRATGRGYQTRMNNVLRAYMNAQSRPARKRAG